MTPRNHSMECQQFCFQTCRISASSWQNTHLNPSKQLQILNYMFYQNDRLRCAGMTIANSPLPDWPAAAIPQMHHGEVLGALTSLLMVSWCLPTSILKVPLFRHDCAGCKLFSFVYLAFPALLISIFPKVLLPSSIHLFRNYQDLAFCILRLCFSWLIATSCLIYAAIKFSCFTVTEL